MKRPDLSARTLWAVAAVFTAITAAVVAFYFVTSSRDASNATMQLQAQLAAQTEQIQRQAGLIQTQNAETEADRLAEASKVECVTRFTYAIQAASSNLLVTLGDLVVVIATTVPGPDREAQVGDGVTKVTAAVVAYRATVQQRIDFDVKGSPLPCPLKPGATG